MGTVNTGKCLNCEHQFEYSVGGGYNFVIVNCDSCHQVNYISWKQKEASETHGICECGGTFRNDAKVRCPECDSDQIGDKTVKIHFD